MEDLKSAMMVLRAQERRLQYLQEEIVRKEAILLGLPGLEVCRLSEPNIRFVRLRSPKEEGQSLKKKQCDLWEYCWGSSALLAYIVSNSGLNMGGKKTLELGGGLGVSTLAIATKYSTRSSIMTDLVEDALKVFRLSLRLGGLRGHAEGKVLNWNRPDEFSGGEPNSFDFIIGSDVLFMGWCAKPVANVVAKYLAEDGILLVVDPFRLNDGAFITNLFHLGITHHKILEFSSELIDLLTYNVLDAKGAVVPVKRAKLIVASRLPIQESLIENILKLGLNL